eukprot:TRINITY_DN8772_c0_g2_i2.p1 TRINITY_DN8772_c0_g2~~TRINITY_DN8772_c0_g2_i2.p1  ORF type:complete len:161 (+),score=39.19 TRINITY_DN8772_c0_g2_i2:221-703(+)
MVIAQSRDAVRQAKFWFRRQLPDELPVGSPRVTMPRDPDECMQMTMDEILNGKPGDFPGLIPLVDLYLKSMNIELDDHCRVSRYLDFLSKRAKGEILTPAQWMREYIAEHPDYKHDSVVPGQVAYDLLKRIDDIAQGTVTDQRLLGDFGPRGCVSCGDED